MVARTRVQQALYFLRWQLGPVLMAVPAHLAFVLRGLGEGRVSVGSRARLAWHMVQIHLSVECGHNPNELLNIVEEVLSLPPGVAGVVVECGAYLGGSTAKLSYAAALTGRRLLVCDSFEGLPEVRSANHTSQKLDFEKGQYAGRLEQVKDNVARYGKIECVEFITGWYEESLARLSGIPIACAFWDVDLRESFVSCISALWADINPSAKIFLHDVDRTPVVEVFTDSLWWTNELGIDPPELVGAFKGLGRLSPLLGYVTKC